MREVQRPLPPTGGLCPDREAKDNAPLSLLCLLFPVPHPCHFFSTLSHHLFTALPLPCSPWAPYVAISYQGDNSNCAIIFPICYLTPSVISESQNRSRSLGTGPIYLPLLYPVNDKICDYVCVFLQLYPVTVSYGS